MAVQFPNFLGAQLVKPDYSGLADAISNYYGGKMMPKDDLIRAVQAEFARPTAEQALLSSQLSNRKSQMEISRLAEEMAQQKELENQLKRAFGMATDSQPTEMPVRQMPQSMNAMPSIGLPASLPTNVTTNLQDQGTDVRKMDARYKKFDNLSGYGATGENQMNESQIPVKQELQETVITPGSRHLYGIDQMYDSNPLSRVFLEKKGYKKSQQVKFDNKTGKTSIITTYPSGKVTVQTTSSTSGEEGIPLTNKLISRNQGVIAGVDNAIPVIQDIINLSDTNNIDQKNKSIKDKSILSGGSPYPVWSISSESGERQAKYDGLVNQALDSLMSAFGMPQTNEGLNSVKKQLQIRWNESDKAYVRRLKELIKDLEKRKEYASTQVKKSVSTPNDFTDVSDDELRSIIDAE